MTNPRPAPVQPANLYLEGNFAPVADETTALALRVSGEIPAELDGRLVRIGPIRPATSIPRLIIGSPEPAWSMGCG